MADFDNDGWKDIFTANSHVNDRIGDFKRSAWKQANSVFRQRRAQGVSATRLRGRDSGGRWPRTAAVASPISTATAVSTSSSSSLGEPAELWQNQAPRRNHWLIVRPVGSEVQS